MNIQFIYTQALRSLVSALDQDAENGGMAGLPTFKEVSPAFLAANANESRQELMKSLSLYGRLFLPHTKPLI